MSKPRRCRKCKRTEAKRLDAGVDFGDEFLECAECDPEGKTDTNQIFIPTEG